MKQLAKVPEYVKKLLAAGAEKLNQKMEKRYLLRSLLFSYCVLMAIPVIVGIVNYSYMTDVLYQEAVDSERLVLENGLNSLDIGFDNIEKTANQLGNDSRILSLLNQRNLRTPQNVITLRSVSDNLPVFYDDYELINSYYIYCRRSDTMISANTVFFDVGFYYDTHFHVDGMSQEAWKEEILGPVHYRTLLPARSVMYKKVPTDCLLYLQEIYTETIGNPSGLIMAYINEKAVQAIMETAADVNASFACLINSSGELMTGLSFDDIALEELQLPAGEYGDEIDIAGETYVVNSMNSRSFGFSYVVGVKKADVLDNAMPILRNMLLHVLLMLLVGVLLAGVLGYININPLIRLIRRLLPPEETGNFQISYHQLDEAMAQLIDNRNALERRVDTQEVLLQEVVFSQIINGEITDGEEIRSLLRHVSIELHAESFRGILLRTDADSDAVRDLLAVYLKRCPRLPFCYCANRMLLLYEETEQEDCAAYLTGLARALEDAYSVRVTFYVGGAGPLSDVHQSFAAARSLANYRQEKILPVVMCDSPLAEAQKSHTYSQTDERKLTSMVEQGDFVGVRLLMEEIYESHFVNSSLPTDALQQLIARLLDTLQRLANGENADVPTLEKCLSSSPRYVFDRMLSSYQRLCERSLTQRQTKTARLAEEIHAYIEDNYNRFDLDLQEVIDHFGISLSYGSRLIKNQLGETFSTILLQMRIEKANNLLRTSSLSIQQISEAVGYDNQNSFRRAYKRAMGISPSEHRTGEPDACDSWDP